MVEHVEHKGKPSVQNFDWKTSKRQIVAIIL
jgi:hypothetical protein